MSALTTTKPKPGKVCTLCHLASGAVTSSLSKARYRISRRQPPYLPSQAYAIPDSTLSRKALALVTECSPTFLLNHSLRSYAFGLAMAHKVKQPIDQEVFFVGSVMHDLGLTEAYSGAETFEIEGARAAREFCLRHDLAPQKADLVHEMVALHNSVGVAHRCDPEIALLHFGAGADVAGLWGHDLNRRTIEEVLARFPEEGFKPGIIALIEQEVRQKPQSYMSTLVELGFLKQMAKTHW
ncbi:hypothetical protein VV869_05470 [Photobacterium sp. MCCC 1A19761]|uniref:hypothetical protein n=1 Tax=Photobacterium sp. MCCC 1A19761 TaxID=3115000 RepID=UPI00307D6239